jgi:hypothetical protein
MSILSLCANKGLSKELKQVVILKSKPLIDR